MSMSAGNTSNERTLRIQTTDTSISYTHTQSRTFSFYPISNMYIHIYTGTTSNPILHKIKLTMATSYSITYRAENYATHHHGGDTAEIPEFRLKTSDGTVLFNSYNNNLLANYDYSSSNTSLSFHITRF